MSSKKNLKKLLIIILLFVLVSCSQEAKEIVEKEININDKFWVKEWNALIYSNAGYDNGIIKMVKKGDHLTAFKQKGEWYKVNFKKLQGWINSNLVSKTQVNGIKITRKRLTEEEKEKVKKYLEKAKDLFNKQKKAEKELNKKYHRTNAGKFDDNQFRYDLAEFQSYPSGIYSCFHSAYKIDPNNLEVMKLLIKQRYKIIIPDHTEFNRSDIKPAPIYLCNYALALNPPDIEWWYNKISSEYKFKSPELSIYFSYKGLEYLNRKKDFHNKSYPDLLYKIAKLSKDIKIKKEYYGKLISDFPNWNLDKKRKINIKDVKRRYKNLLKKAK